MAQNKLSWTPLNRRRFWGMRHFPVGTATEMGRTHQAGTKQPESGDQHLTAAPIIRANTISFGLSHDGRTRVTFFDCG
jgi:hypothetical protein